MWNKLLVYDPAVLATLIGKNGTTFFFSPLELVMSGSSSFLPFLFLCRGRLGLMCSICTRGRLCSGKVFHLLDVGLYYTLLTGHVGPFEFSSVDRKTMF